MPELPEVETTRRGIEPFIRNRKITSVSVHNARLRWPVPDSIQQLCGTPIQTVTRRGKYILLNSKKGTALIHLGMSGSLRICNSGSSRKKHDHVEFHLPNDRILRFHDPRRFGCILWEADDIEKHPLLIKLGPEPLSGGFNGTYLAQHAKKRKVAIKNLIMDSQCVVGVGNIYASESLFLAGIRPGRAAAGLSKSECSRLTETIKQVLTEAIAAGGTTLKDFVNSDGKPGYFAQSLRVYGRHTEPCRICGTAVKKKIIGQRASFYCPRCQS